MHRWNKLVGGWPAGGMAALLILVGGGMNLAEEKAAKEPYLVFKIVANPRDDGKGLEAAKAYFAAAKKDAKKKAELARRALAGEPPPPVEVAGRKGPAYTWVEVGRLHLSRLHRFPDEESKKQWEDVAKARARGEPIFLPRITNSGVLFYSRPCVNKNLSKKAREEKEADSFLLVREPEPGKAVTSTYLESVKKEADLRGRPGISLELNKKGDELMRELTRKNSPSGTFERSIVVILDGRSVMAAAVFESFGSPIFLGASWKEKELAELIEALRRDLVKDKE
jgi:hypothetical protein